jgi:hypothetical protein
MANRFKIITERQKPKDSVPAQDRKRVSQHLPGQQSFVDGMDMPHDSNVISVENKPDNEFYNLGDIPIVKPNGKTTGFYLSYEVQAVIEKIAAQRNVKKSRVVEKALRQVFNIG